MKVGKEGNRREEERLRVRNEREAVVALEREILGREERH